MLFRSSGASPFDRGLLPSSTFILPSFYHCANRPPPVTGTPLNPCNPRTPFLSKLNITRSFQGAGLPLETELNVLTRDLSASDEETFFLFCYLGALARMAFFFHQICIPRRPPPIPPRFLTDPPLYSPHQDEGRQENIKLSFGWGVFLQTFVDLLNTFLETHPDILKSHDRPRPQRVRNPKIDLLDNP